MEILKVDTLFMQDSQPDSSQPKPMAKTQSATQESPITLGLQEGDAIPEHVVIIMDGNHRWARARHLPGGRRT